MTSMYIAWHGYRRKQPQRYFGTDGVSTVTVSESPDFLLNYGTLSQGMSAGLHVY